MTAEERRELVNYRITRAKNTLAEIKLLIENELWNTAATRLYYACYYAVTALLINESIETQTHAGARQMFGLHFLKTGVIEKESGKFYSQLFDLRHSGDYDDFIDILRLLHLLLPEVLIFIFFVKINFSLKNYA